MLDLRQLFEKESSTYTYLLADTEAKEAVLIDSVLDTVERDVKLIDELGYRLMWALDTHVHADHLSAAATLRDRVGCKLGLSGKSASPGIYTPLKAGMVVSFGQYRLQVCETPGHTPCSLTFVINDTAFTGDALLIRGCGRTDFQEGDAGVLYDSITRQIFSLPDSTRVYPGHDYKGFTFTTVAEEKLLNPRLTKSRSDFIAFMLNLKLDPPKRINEAVPYNKALRA